MVQGSDPTNKRRQLVVDVHSHLYPTFYLDLLKSRSTAPYVKDNKLVNRASAAGAGKPITPVLFDVATKLDFMNRHGIDVSILSIGNPWIDFLDPDDRDPNNAPAKIAQDINDQFDALCASVAGERLYFFATLPLSAGTEVILEEISRLRKTRDSGDMKYLRGIVMGCAGLGTGLDDPDMLPIWHALAAAQLPVFIHPNYGLPGDVFGPRAKDYGQILQISLSFPLETTIAVTRMILAGVFQAVAELKLIVSHAGGTLPFLAGRVENAIDHDRLWISQGKAESHRQTIWDVLRTNIFLDGIVYDKIPLKMAVEVAGVDRVMFGTDHPFFPPPDGGDSVPSMWSNERAVSDGYGKDSEEYKKVMGGNAMSVLGVGCGCSH